MVYFGNRRNRRYYSTNTVYNIRRKYNILCKPEVCIELRKPKGGYNSDS
jgi:hypothetical protein